MPQTACPTASPSGALPRPGTRWRRWARAGAVTYLVVVLVAVAWPSGSGVADAKSVLGPWFLSAHGKDVVLNLVMVAPLTLLASLGWPRVPWWGWALAGCGLGAVAELTQHLLPVLHRRASWANVAQNGAGAWAGALLAEIGTYARRDRLTLHRER